MTRSCLLEAIRKNTDKGGPDDILWDHVETRGTVAELAARIVTPALHGPARQDSAAVTDTQCDDRSPGQARDCNWNWTLTKAAIAKLA